MKAHSHGHHRGRDRMARWGSADPGMRRRPEPIPRLSKAPTRPSLSPGLRWPEPRPAHGGRGARASRQDREVTAHRVHQRADRTSGSGTRSMGRSFATAILRACQGTKVIATSIASLHVPEAGPSARVSRPLVGRPVRNTGWTIPCCPGRHERPTISTAPRSPRGNSRSGCAHPRWSRNSVPRSPPITPASHRDVVE